MLDTEGVCIINPEKQVFLPTLAQEMDNAHLHADMGLQQEQPCPGQAAETMLAKNEAELWPYKRQGAFLIPAPGTGKKSPEKLWLSHPWKCSGPEWMEL